MHHVWTNRVACAINMGKAMLVFEPWLESSYGAQYVTLNGVCPCYVVSKHSYIEVKSLKP